MAKVIFAATVGLLVLLMISGYETSNLNRDDKINNQDFEQELSRQIPLWMDQYAVPGVAIALIKHGDLIWSDAYGFAKLKEQIPMTTQTMCRVESISKSVTARGIMKLVETGKIDLDDSASQYLMRWQFPHADYDVQQITIRQLLSHSSGLALGTLGLEYHPEEDKPTLTESLTKEAMMIQQPGRGFHYSNIGYHLLELIIEEVTGQKFSEYMREEVLLPLDMKNAGFDWSENFITPVPDGHDLNGNPVPVYVYSEKAAGGLFANVEDVAQFVLSGMSSDFYSDNNILSERGVRKLYTPVIETSGIYSFVSDYYGLGHFTETLQIGEKAIFGGGQGHGWMTHFHLVPDSGDGIVILTNSSRSWPLISHILSEWTAWKGYGAVGMELISGAQMLLRSIIAGIILLCLWFAGRTLLQYRNGLRKWSLSFGEYQWPQILKILIVIFLVSLLIWVQTRDYFFLTSVFPQAAGWLIFALWCIVITMILTVLLQKAECGHRPAGLN